MSFLLAQTWRDLLFAHWPVQPEQVRAWLPAGIELDTFDGEAWIAIVPFLMTGIRFRGTPALPYLSRTLELNVRTYVKVRGRPGIFFFSLDADNPVAVRIARWFFHLPYFDARIHCVQSDGEYLYRSDRNGVAFEARYRAVAPVEYTVPGSIESFLTERYSFYTANRRGLILRGRISHGPWPLQIAEAEFSTNSLTLPWNIDLPDTKPLLHFSKTLDIHAHRVRSVSEDWRL